MKNFKFTILVFAIFSLLSSACKKDEKSQVELEYSVLFPILMEIDTSEVDSMIVRESNEFPTTLDGELAKHNTNKSKITSAKITSMRLQMLDLDFNDTITHSDFGHLAEIMMDIKKDPLPQRLVASQVIANKRTNAVNMKLEDVELKEYLQQNSFGMVIKYRKRKLMPNDLPFFITVKFKIIADPL